MSDVQTVPVADLEEMLNDEIPCGGIRNRAVARTCDRPAVLRKHGHGHGDESPYAFKCIQCWQAWYAVQARLLIKHGRIGCSDCLGIFYTVESFADYRPF